MAFRTIAALVKDGLVTIGREKARGGGSWIDADKVRITDNGARRARGDAVSRRSLRRRLDAPAFHSARCPKGGPAMPLPLFLAGRLFKPSHQSFVGGSNIAHLLPSFRVFHGLGFGQNLSGARSQVARMRQKTVDFRHCDAAPLAATHRIYTPCRYKESPNLVSE